jgi:hypothetical protein
MTDKKAQEYYFKDCTYKREAVFYRESDPDRDAGISSSSSTAMVDGSMVVIYEVNWSYDEPVRVVYGYYNLTVDKNSNADFADIHENDETYKYKEYTLEALKTMFEGLGYKEVKYKD